MARDGGVRAAVKREGGAQRRRGEVRIHAVCRVRAAGAALRYPAVRGAFSLRAAPTGRGRGALCAGCALARACCATRERCPHLVILVRAVYYHKKRTQPRKVNAQCLTARFTPIVEEIAAGRRAAAVTVLGADKSVAKQFFSEKELLSEGTADAGSPLELARRALQSGELELYETGDGRVLFAEPYAPPSRLIILGGGHIALPLAEFGAKCGFSVTVADDRPMFANRQRFPWADEVICESFDRVFERLGINRSAFVVIVTRGHRHDLDCLRAVLPLETAYVGMIIKRRVRAAFGRCARGFPQEAIDRVHSHRQNRRAHAGGKSPSPSSRRSS